MFATGLRRNSRLFGDSRGFQVGESLIGWASLVASGSRVAATLFARGIAPGDRVAAVLPNGEALLSLFACGCLSGIVIVPLNFRWTADELALALKDCAAAALVADEDSAEQATAAAQMTDTPFLDAASLAASHGEGVDAEPLSEWPMASTERLMAIFYTGGTTGRPKGVMLSESNIGYSAMSHISAGLFGEGETVLHVCPAFHIAGAISIFSTFLSGANGVVMSSFDAPQALELIESRNITQSLLVPTMLQMLLHIPARPEINLTSVNGIAYGAAPMPQPLLALARSAFERARFTQLYGMTETAPTSCVLRQCDYEGDGAKADRIRSVGRPIAGTEIKVVDAGGMEVARGTFGEICTRSPGVMMGYWSQPEETSAVLRNGWMHTGDGGRMDEDGFVYLADRLKDMIITGGENVYSVEVENVLSAHPAVRQCAVIGLPDPQWGEAVHAVAVLTGDVAVEKAELLAFCRERLAAFKVPKAVTFWPGALPMSAAGKILKRDLRVALGEVSASSGKGPCDTPRPS